jgi:hypothetical protein
VDFAGWTATVLGIAAILPAVVSIPKDAAHRRPALIASGVLVLLALGIGAVSLWAPRPASSPEPIAPTNVPAVPDSSPTAPTRADVATMPSTATADDDPQWAGAVRLTSSGLDLDRVPEGADSNGNDLSLKFEIGGPLRMMAPYGSAVWPSPTTPTRRQCAELLATQPLGAMERLNIPVKNAALCVQTSEQGLAFFRVTGTTSTGSGPVAGLNSAAVADVRTWPNST